MSSLNKIILIGNVSFDPDIKVTTNGHNVAKLSLAVDRPSGPNTVTPQCDFIPVVSWNETAEYVQKNIQKGDQVLVIGRISERTYEDSEGVRKWITEIDARSIQKLSTNSRTDAQEDSSTELSGTFPNETVKSPNQEKKDPELKADASPVSEENFNFNDPFQSPTESSSTEKSKEAAEESVPF